MENEDLKVVYKTLNSGSYVYIYLGYEKNILDRLLPLCYLWP